MYSEFLHETFTGFGTRILQMQGMWEDQMEKSNKLPLEALTDETDPKVSVTWMLLYSLLPLCAGP